MLRKILLFSILVFLFQSAKAQVLRSDPVVDKQFGIIKELKSKSPDPIGSTYLNDDWVVGNILLTSDEEIKSVPLKYDLKNNLLEIQTSSAIKVVPFYRLKSFDLNYKVGKYTFLNASKLNLGSLSGIVQPLVLGQLSLYSKPELEKIPANYNAALDVGEKADKYVKKEKLYLVKANEAYDITKTNKKVLKYFGSTTEQIKAYTQKENLSFKNLDDLIKIVSYYNQLTGL